MALLFECMGKCCRNMLDTADIVRDACFRQRSASCWPATSPFARAGTCCGPTRRRSLPKTGVSDNVGGVKHVATTLPHALEQERHFALIGEVLNPTKARFLISIQVGKLSSTHASLRSQARS